MLKRTLLLVGSAIVLAACGAIGGAPQGSATDSTAAQQFVPTVANYTVTDADSVSDALQAVGEGATSIAGRPEIAAAINRIDSVLDCYQDVGAVTARVYTQANIVNLATGETPKIGGLVIINETRLAENLVPCIAAAAQEGFSAQSAGVDPCAGDGTFVVEGDTIRYAYASSTPELCQVFESHFAQYGAS